MIGRPRPISAAQALGYFLQESQGVVQLVEHESFPPEFGGSLLPLLGLKAGPFSLDEYTDFVLGDFPALKNKSLSLARASAASPEDLERAVYEVAVSFPKSLSLQLLLSGDVRMHQIARDANTAALKMFEEYCVVRVTLPNGLTEKIRVQGIAYASWFHISSREREPNDTADIIGGADAQFHVHNLVHRLVLPRGYEQLLSIQGRDIQISHQAVMAMA